MGSTVLRSLSPGSPFIGVGLLEVLPASPHHENEGMGTNHPPFLIFLAQTCPWRGTPDLAGAGSSPSPTILGRQTLTLKPHLGSPPHEQEKYIISGREENLTETSALESQKE